MIDKIANSQCSILAKDDVFNDIQVLRLLGVRSIGGRHAVVRICRRYDTQQGPLENQFQVLQVKRKIFSDPRFLFIGSIRSAKSVGVQFRKRVQWRNLTLYFKQMGRWFLLLVPSLKFIIYRRGK